VERIGGDLIYGGYDSAGSVSGLRRRSRNSEDGTLRRRVSTMRRYLFYFTAKTFSPINRR